MADLRQKWPKLSLFEFCYIRNAFVYFYQDKEVPLFWLNCAKTIFSNSFLSSELWYITYGTILSRTVRFFFFQSMLYTSYDVFQEQLIY